MLQSFSQRNGAEDSDAFPGAESDVIDPATISAAEVLFGPGMHLQGGVQVFRVSGGVGYAQQGVDGVAATAVQNAAGGAGEGAVYRGVTDAGDLVGEQTIAPVL